MSNWHIEIPNRGPDQPIFDAMADARHLESESRATTRALLLDAAANGSTRVGDVLERIERASPAAVFHRR